MSGSWVIGGIKDATEGNFSSVTVQGVTWYRAPHWQTIDNAPAAHDAPDKKIIVIGGAWAEPTVVMADGSWWRYRRQQGHPGMPTHWMDLPAPPSFAASTSEISSSQQNQVT